MRRPNFDRLRLEISRSQGPFVWLIAIVVFGLIGAAIIVSNLTGNLPFSSRYDFRVSVPDASGLAPGRQEVQLAGVKIGVVKDSKLVDGKAVLTLAIDKKYAPIYHDARLQIRPNTPLEDLYVSIDSRGTPGTGKLAKGDIIPASQTETAVKESKILDVFTPDTRQSMQTLLAELSKGAPDNGAKLQAAFAEAAPFLGIARSTARILDQRRVLLSRAVTNLDKLVGALGDRDQQLVQLIHSGEASLGELSQEDKPFADTIRELPPTMSTARGAFDTLRDTESQLDPALRSLEPVAGKLTGGATSLERVAKAANPALDQLTPALKATRPFARQLRPTAASLRGATEALRPQTPDFDHITSLVVPCEDAISGFFNNTLSVFKFYDAFGAFPRGNTTEDESSLGGTGTATLKQYEPCTGSPTK